VLLAAAVGLFFLVALLALSGEHDAQSTEGITFYEEE